MSVFTTLTSDEVQSWLCGYEAGALESLEGIAEGVENTNYFVTTTSGRFVLTVFERLGADIVGPYLALMDHLASKGLPCPRPMADRSGRFLSVLSGKPAVLATRLSGKACLLPTEDECRAIGSTLGQMHEAVSDWPVNGGIPPNPRGFGWRKKTGAYLLKIKQDFPVWFDAFNGIEQALALDETVQVHCPDLPSGVIHADLFRDNVLLSVISNSDTAGLITEVSGLLDFYFSGVDSFLFDLAVTCNDWCGLDERLTRALLDGYSALRALTDLEKQLWPMMRCSAALRFWLSRLHDICCPRMGDLVTCKDPREYRSLWFGLYSAINKNTDSIHGGHKG